MPEIKNPLLATATITGRVCHTPEVRAFCDGKTLAGLYWYEQFLAGRIDRIAAV